MKRKPDPLPKRVTALQNRDEHPSRQARRLVNKFKFIETTQAQLDNFRERYPHNRLSISQKEKYLATKRAELTALLDEYDAARAPIEPSPKPKRAHREQPGA